MSRLWFRRLSLYVAPSRNEGFGLTPLEAMASRTPVVASDAGAYAEMVVPGETGAVVPAGDGEALTSAIGTYLADPSLAEAHGRQALAHVRRHFPLAREAEGVAKAYDRLWSAQMIDTLIVVKSNQYGLTRDAELLASALADAGVRDRDRRDFRPAASRPSARAQARAPHHPSRARLPAMDQRGRRQHARSQPGAFPAAPPSAGCAKST